MASSDLFSERDDGVVFEISVRDASFTLIPAGPFPLQAGKVVLSRDTALLRMMTVSASPT